MIPKKSRLVAGFFLCPPVDQQVWFVTVLATTIFSSYAVLHSHSAAASQQLC